MKGESTGLTFVLILTVLIGFFLIITTNDMEGFFLGIIIMIMGMATYVKAGGDD